LPQPGKGIVEKVKKTDFRRRIQLVSELPRSTKRFIMVAADVVMIPLALYTAITLRLGSIQHQMYGGAWLYLAVVLTSVAVFAKLGLYRAVIRYIGGKAVIAVVAGVTLSVALILVLNLTVTQRALPMGALAIYGALAMLYVGGSRLLVRLALQESNGSAARVVIYGAGEAGVRLTRALQGSKDYKAVAFVDDSHALHGSVINGLQVFAPTELSHLVAEYEVTGVLLALPSETRRRRREILARLESLGIHVQTIPDLSDIVSGRARVDEVQEVDVEDLLGRDAVPPNPALFSACIRERSVLVTGAGGSIGSELCRQIIRLQPTRLVLLETSELALYNIDKELRVVAAREALGHQIVPLLGNAQHKNRMREIMQTYGVQTVYHAAAYKHVPIVEHNMIEGVYNNVFATWHTAEAAIETGVETFVLVSTDKAVNPANVMGAAKRLAELVLQGLQLRGATTRFCMVRFGNVLASSGSVVPLFHEQIRGGGPVTVTHPDVIRYFMTIPEAAQLVIQAGSMAEGGDVFVLDMGKPVRIDDLARRMVNLMGLTVRDPGDPDGDIEIAYTGLRPAEKLFEELLIGNSITGTQHPMILRAKEHSLPWERLQAFLEELQVSLRKFDCRTARELLLDVIAEYKPGNGIEDLVWVQHHPVSMAPQPPTAPEKPKVAELAARRAARQPDRTQPS
jgi:FlaA1/EpsC-like NDP-sugar epimerase